MAASYFVVFKVFNNYGKGIEVRGSPYSIFGSFILGDNETREVLVTTSSRKPVVLRIYDENDGIPIPVNGMKFARLTPRESEDFVYNLVVNPGKMFLYMIFFINVNIYFLCIISRNNLIT